MISPSKPSSQVVDVPMAAAATVANMAASLESDLNAGPIREQQQLSQEPQVSAAAAAGNAQGQAELSATTSNARAISPAPSRSRTPATSGNYPVPLLRRMSEHFMPNAIRFGQPASRIPSLDFQPGDALSGESADTVNRRLTAENAGLRLQLVYMRTQLEACRMALQEEMARASHEREVIEKMRPKEKEVAGNLGGPAVGVAGKASPAKLSPEKDKDSNDKERGSSARMAQLSPRPAVSRAASERDVGTVSPNKQKKK